MSYDFHQSQYSSMQMIHAPDCNSAILQSLPNSTILDTYRMNPPDAKLLFLIGEIFLQPVGYEVPLIPKTLDIFKEPFLRAPPDIIQQHQQADIGRHMDREISDRNVHEPLVESLTACSFYIQHQYVVSSLLKKVDWWTCFLMQLVTGNRSSQLRITQEVVMRAAIGTAS